MPSRSNVIRKTANRIKAHHKWVNYYKEIYGCEPSEKENRLFLRAFNMGWKTCYKESKKGFGTIRRYKASRQQKVPKND